MNRGQRLWVAFILLWLAVASLAAIYMAGIMTMTKDRGDGEVIVGAKDAPIDHFAALHVDFGPTHLVRANGTWVSLGDGADLDLLRLREDRWAPVANGTAPAGDYVAVAFTFQRAEAHPHAAAGNGSLPGLGGDESPEPTPLATAPEALVVQVSFTVPSDGALTLVVDFDAEESVQATATGLEWAPVVKAVHSSAADSDGDGAHDVADWDDDNDGLPDWRDADRDGDGAPDSPAQARRAPPGEQTF